MTETKCVRNGIITAKLQKTHTPFPLLIYHNRDKSSKCAYTVKLNESYRNESYRNESYQRFVTHEQN